MKRTLIVAAALAATLAAPLAASAQDRYDGGDRYDRDDHQVVGRIVDASPYNLQLDRGPHVLLHSGTVIRPRGLTLRDGMPVRVIGRRTDGGFSADEVDLVRHDRDRDGDDGDRH